MTRFPLCNLSEWFIHTILRVNEMYVWVWRFYSALLMDYVKASSVTRVDVIHYTLVKPFSCNSLRAGCILAFSMWKKDPAETSNFHRKFHPLTPIFYAHMIWQLDLTTCISLMQPVYVESLKEHPYSGLDLRSVARSFWENKWLVWQNNLTISDLPHKKKGFCIYFVLIS